MDFAALAQRAVEDGMDPHLVPPPLAPSDRDERLLLAALAMGEAQATATPIDLSRLAARLGIQIGEAHEPLPHGLLAVVSRPPNETHDLVLLSPHCTNVRAALAVAISSLILRPEQSFALPLPAGLPDSKIVAVFAFDLLVPPGAFASLHAQGLDAADIARRLRAPLLLVRERMAKA